MLKRNLEFLALLAAVSLFIGDGYGKPAADESDKIYKFDQELEGEIAGKLLKQGTYSIIITYENEEKGRVKILRNKQVIAELPCKVEKLNMNLKSNGVAYGINSEGKRFIRWLLLRDRREKVIIAP